MHQHHQPKLSFAQILQKQPSIQASKHQSPCSSPFLQSQAQLQSQSHRQKQSTYMGNAMEGSRKYIGQSSRIDRQFQLPTMAEFMNLYIGRINGEIGQDEDFVISFQGYGQQVDNGYGQQDFQMGVNALDSFIMSKGYLNSKKLNPKPQTQPQPQSRLQPKIQRAQSQKQQSLSQLAQRFLTAKQNMNRNIQQFPSQFPASKPTILARIQSSKLPQSQGSVQDIDFSSKNRTKGTGVVGHGIQHPIEDIKIIRSQAYQGGEMQRSKQNGKQGKDTGKVSRYESNYQETERKEEVGIDKRGQIIPVSGVKMILSKTGPQKTQLNNQTMSDRNMPSPILTKKESSQQQLLIGDFQVKQQSAINAYSQHDKRIQDAKRQINELLLIRQKNSNQNPPNFSKSSKICSIIQKITAQHCPANAQIPFSQSPHPHQAPTKKQITISFSQPLEFPQSQPLSQYPTTKKQLKQLHQQNIEKNNQMMLECIEYTRSEVDQEELEANGKEKQEKEGQRDRGDKEEDLLIGSQWKKNKEVYQSIPQGKSHYELSKDMEVKQKNFTLQKYLPHKLELELQPQSQQKLFQDPPNLNIPIIAKNINNPSQLAQPSQKPNQSQQYQYSDMIQIIQVQPSIQQQPQPQPQRQSKPTSQQPHPTGKLKKLDSNLSNLSGISSSSNAQVPLHYNNNSSIDVKVSDSNHQNSNSKLNISNNSYQPIQIPMLNITNFSSSTHSHPLEPEPEPCVNALNPLNLKTQQSNNPSDPSHTNSHNTEQLLEKHENFGYIYRMRIGSRNSSFTSDYGREQGYAVGIGIQQDGNGGMSNCSSLNFQSSGAVAMGQSSRRREYAYVYGANSRVHDNCNTNMNMNKMDKKYTQVCLSLQPNNQQQSHEVSQQQSQYSLINNSNQDNPPLQNANENAMSYYAHGSAKASLDKYEDMIVGRGPQQQEQQGAQEESMEDEQKRQEVKYSCESVEIWAESAPIGDKQKEEAQINTQQTSSQIQTITATQQLAKVETTITAIKTEQLTEIEPISDAQTQTPAQIQIKQQQQPQHERGHNLQPQSQNTIEQTPLAQSQQQQQIGQQDKTTTVSQIQQTPAQQQPRGYNIMEQKQHGQQIAAGMQDKQEYKQQQAIIQVIAQQQKQQQQQQQEHTHATPQPQQQQQQGSLPQAAPIAIPSLQITTGSQIGDKIQQKPACSKQEGKSPLSAIDVNASMGRNMMDGSISYANGNAIKNSTSLANHNAIINSMRSSINASSGNANQDNFQFDLDF